MPTQDKIFTHAIAMNVDGAPEGYYPLGSAEDMKEYFDTNKDKLAVGAQVATYEVLKEPEFLEGRLNAEHLIKRAKALANQGETFTFDPKAIQDEFTGVVKPVKEGFDLLKTMLEKSIKERKAPDPMAMATVAMAGTQVMKSANELKDKFGDQAFRALYFGKDDNFAVNEHGVFASKAWLDNAENARSLMRLKVQPPKPAAQKSVASSQTVSAP